MVTPKIDPKGILKRVEHGAQSDMVLSAKAVEIETKLLAARPYLDDPAFTDSVRLYCRAKARSELLHTHVMTVSTELGVEEVRPYLWTEASRAEANAFAMAKELGFTPLGYAQLMKEMGWAEQLRKDNLKNLAEAGARLRGIGPS